MSRSVRRRLLLACLVLIPAALAPRAPARPAEAPYKAAIVVDAATGRILRQENADAISPPASMTKLMTYAVLSDQMRDGLLSLDTRVTVTAADEQVASQRDSSHVDLRKGEVFPVEDLLYAMFVHSANDAAYALAHAGGTTVEAFVGRMNAKARQLGMTRSVFRTPNGFPVRSHRIADGDLTSARDFAVLCRYLLLNTDVLRYSSVPRCDFGKGILPRPIPMTNHNNLLVRGVPGVDGLKTGFTNGAGFCISATALRGGRRVIVVVMDSPDQKTRDLHTIDLLRIGFESIPLGEPPFRRTMAGAAGGGAPGAAQAKAPAPAAGSASPMIHFP